MNKINIAIIGCGWMSENHLRSYIELRRNNIDSFEIIAISDISEERMNLFKNILEEQNMFIPNTYTNYLEMLDKEDLDAVDICLPHYLHHTVAIDCIEKDLHVIIEKPLAVTIKAAKKIIDAANRKNKLLVIAEQLYKWTSIRTLKWVIQHGNIGDPKMFIANRVVGNWKDIHEETIEEEYTWRLDKIMSGGGIIYDWGIHYCSILLDIFGEVDTIYSIVKNLKKTNYSFNEKTNKSILSDTMNSLINFKSKVFGTWSFSIVMPGRWLDSVAYYGTEGSILANNIIPREFSLYTVNGTEIPYSTLRDEFIKSLNEYEHDKLFPPELNIDYLNSEEDYGITLELYEFIKCLLYDEYAEVEGTRGIESQALAISFIESSVVNKVVKFEDIMNEKVNSYQKEINTALQI